MRHRREGGQSSRSWQRTAAGMAGIGLQRWAVRGLQTTPSKLYGSLLEKAREEP